VPYEIDNKRVLGLELPTDPRWVNMAEISLEDILTDHAFCELKAASQCISLISLYPQRKELVEQVSPIVTEEWGHFRMVLKELDNRGLALGNQRKDLYVNELLKFQTKGGSLDTRLLEKLMTFALIEARSCERFRLLSIHIAEDELKEFYHKFMVSEAGHYKMFLELARLYFGEEVAMSRWKEYLEYEAEVMKNLETRGDRMH
jgi:tRNA-(ms[2]io[6]A)-hydroxylase